MASSSARSLMQRIRDTLLWRVGTVVVGAVVVLIGVVMIFTPGPAIVVIPAGLLILTESGYAWTTRLKEHFPKNFDDANTQAKGYWGKLKGKFTKR